MHEFLTLKEHLFGTLKSFRYAKCTNCGCLQIAEIPDDLKQFYPPDYYSYSVNPPHPEKGGPIRRAMQRARMRQRLFGTPKWADRLFWRFAELPWAWSMVRDYLRAEWLPAGMKTFFLDVGCGSRSWWLDNLAKLGFRHLEGIDPFISSDQTHDGIFYRKADLGDTSGTYDFISMHHSLEHIPNQQNTLRAAASLLSDNGTLLIRIPVFSDILWQEYGDCCMSLDAPRHLYLHTPESLRYVASQAGLKVVENFYDSDGFTIIGSEQYRLGLTLFGPKSYFNDAANSPITKAQAEAARAYAKKLNENHTADCSAFFLRKA